MPSREEEKKQKIRISVRLLVLSFFIMGIMIFVEYVFYPAVSNNIFFNIVSMFMVMLSLYSFFELLDAIAWDIM